MNPESTLEAIRILVVDDEPVCLESTADLLRLEGYHVDTAPDGLQAQRLVEAHDYNFLISDLMMPGNQDLAFLHQAASAKSELQIIVVTGYPTLATAQESIQLPVVAYMVKPADMEEMIEHLERGRANRRIQRTLTQSRERTQTWLEDMKAVQSLLRHPTRSADQDSARTILGLAVSQQLAQLLDMREIFEGSFNKGAVTEFCAVERCPRLARYEAAVQDAIQVLEHTKTVFRSKELAQLRTRLEQLNSGQAPGELDNPH